MPVLSRAVCLVSAFRCPIYIALLIMSYLLRDALPHQVTFVKAWVDARNVDIRYRRVGEGPLLVYKVQMS